MLVIGSNSAALRAANAIRLAQAAAEKSMERMATGKRINSVADDPAGFFIAARMMKDIQGKQQAARNVQDGLGFAQTADGALSGVADMLQRIRELATTSASGTYSDGNRANMQVEVTQLVEQIKSVLTSSKFNGIKLFQPTGGTADVAVQSGADDGQVNKIGIESYDLSKLDQLSVATAADASAALSLSDTLLEATSTSRAQLGATMNVLSMSVDGLQNMGMIESEAYGRIMDVDYAYESMQLAKNQLLMSSATAMLVQANSMPRKLVEMLLTA